MTSDRTSGILLHLSSLPGKFGIGDIGKSAFQWVDFLHLSGTKYWQILPLNPTGYGNSPYQGLSAFAGNPLFIDLDNLAELGLLDPSDLENPPVFPIQKIIFPSVERWKTSLLQSAHRQFLKTEPTGLNIEYHEFLEENKFWLDDFALFMALRLENHLASWSDWPVSLRMRDTAAIKSYCQANRGEIDYQRFLQFIFFRQWFTLKSYANTKGILLIGDIPIFTGFDCADVWAHSELFQLDANRKPSAVAGVPPDFFSETGQLWGNPLYRWEAHEKDKFSWWRARIKNALNTVDRIRLDHFRGFAGYYRIPADAATAMHGEWVTGPGSRFFFALQKFIGSLPFIAEDLGVITPDVEQLRDLFGFPGMRILQFAFGSDASHAYLPHNYPANCVAYTGTHDNKTCAGWYKTASNHEKDFCARYLGYHTQNIAHEMIRAVWQSPASLAITPMQDFLQLGGWARMNTPSSVGGNWIWRMKSGAASKKLAEWIREINLTYGRFSE